MTVPTPDDTVRSVSAAWLHYYSECRQFLLVMGQKYTSLLAQASVFTFATCTVITVLAERAGVTRPALLLVAGASAVGLLMYGLMTIAYFGQIRVAGDKMARIEAEHLRLSAERDWGLIATIRKSRSRFFARPGMLVVVVAYFLILVGLVLAAAFITPLSAARGGT